MSSYSIYYQKSLLVYYSICFQVYDLSQGRPKYSITGLEVLRTPNNCNHCLLVVTTPDAIYTFQEILRAEEKSLQSVFTPYVAGGRSYCCKIERTDLNYSVWRTYTEPNVKFPLNWGWLCGTGVKYGEVNFAKIEHAIDF